MLSLKCLHIPIRHWKRKQKYMHCAWIPLLVPNIVPFECAGNHENAYFIVRIPQGKKRISFGELLKFSIGIVSH